jgi:hypothetical protein
MLDKRFVMTVAAAMVATQADAGEWSPTYLGCMFTGFAVSGSDNIYPDRRNEKLLEVGTAKFEIAFAAIDLPLHRAQLVGNLGSEQINAFRGGHDSVVFLEVTPVGNVNLTTVLPPAADGTIRAVTSRHIAEPLSGYSFSQYLGSCKEHVGEFPSFPQ